MARRRRIHWWPVVGAAAAASLALAGCGSSNNYANKLRPPAPITITAAIIRGHIQVSPNRFGAGPVQLIVTNQSDRTHELELISANPPGTPRPGLRQGTGPINPQDTAEVQADLPPGVYSLQARDATVRPGRIVVTRSRPSSQNQLLLP